MDTQSLRNEMASWSTPMLIVAFSEEIEARAKAMGHPHNKADQKKQAWLVTLAARAWGISEKINSLS